MSFKIREDHLIAYANFFEEHPEFARGRLSCSNAREEFKKLWGELSNNLNALGYGTRTIEKWQRTWSDYKLNLKKRASELKRQQSQTGGGPLINKGLSDTDNRLLNILGKTFFEGCGTQEKGFELYQQKLVIHKKKNYPATITSESLLSVSPAQQTSQIDVNNIANTTALASSPSTPLNQSHERGERAAIDDNGDINEDHDYLATNVRLPGRVASTSNLSNNVLSEYYQDTINILNNITNRLDKLDNRLKNINDTLNNKLTELCSILQNNKR